MELVLHFCLNPSFYSKFTEELFLTEEGVQGSGFIPNAQDGDESSG